MAHFAEIDADNKVVRVIVVNNSELIGIGGAEDESMGVQFCAGIFGGNWIQTSYNGTKRKRFAGIGFSYDPQRDAFIPPKPFASWVFDETTLDWKAPIAYPQDGSVYTWDENTVSWQIVTSDETAKS